MRTPVLRRRIQAGVSHLQRRVPERLRVRHPRQPPVRPVAESGQRRLEALRIFFERQPAHQVRLLRRVAEIVVVAAGTGIRPADDAVDRGETLVFARERGGFGEAREQPAAVVQRRLEAVERRAAADGDGAGSARRSAAAECSGTAPRQGCRRAGAIPAPVCSCASPRIALGLRQRLTRFAALGRAQPLERALLDGGLVQQAAADVGIVVGAVERLLEAPVAAGRAAPPRAPSPGTVRASYRRRCWRRAARASSARAPAVPARTNRYSGRR